MVTWHVRIALLYGYSTSPDEYVGSFVVFWHVRIVLLYFFILHLRMSALVILWVSELWDIVLLCDFKDETTALQSTGFC